MWGSSDSSSRSASSLAYSHNSRLTSSSQSANSLSLSRRSLISCNRFCMCSFPASAYPRRLSSIGSLPLVVHYLTVDVEILVELTGLTEPSCPRDPLLKLSRTPGFARGAQRSARWSQIPSPIRRIPARGQPDTLTTASASDSVLPLATV